MEKLKRLQKRTIARSLLLFLLSICIGLGTIVGCEGPAGQQGPQGPEGPQGPVGPAGDDGSMMYSGQGTPTSDIGSEGDYYINTNTGELFGPKDADGWGNAIMVMMGQDGQDGQDGSQIYAGTGAPTASKGKVGDYYLDKSSYGLYGPKTSNGWGSPINLKGADGNANVTRYIYPSHDFQSQPSLTLEVSSISNDEFRNSSWLIYLAFDRGINNSTFRYYSIPGDGKYASYSVSFGNINDDHAAFFIEASGTAVKYARIEIVRIAATNTVDNTKANPQTMIPKDLDTSSFQEVAENYGFGNIQ